MNAPTLKTFSLHESPNNDLKLIKTFLHNSFEPTIEPRSAGELSSILKNRLAKANIGKDQKIRCRQWLANQGLNIQPMLDYVTKSKKDRLEEATTRGVKLDSSISKTVIQPLLFTQEDYLTKAIEYSSIRLKQHISSSRNCRKRFINQIIDRLGTGEAILEKKENYIITTSQPQIRDQRKKEKYIQLFLDLVKREQQETVRFKNKSFKSEVDWVGSFSDICEHKIWKVLGKQFKGIKFEQKPPILQKMLLNSLKIVQSQFNQQLPLNDEAITYFLQQNYLSKFEYRGEYIIDQHHGSFWGKVFILYRAGRIKEVLQLLKKYDMNDMAEKIKVSEEKIKFGIPAKCQRYFEDGDKDVFKDQLNFALQGQRKYSSDVLSDPMELDCVWILLRNTGIFTQTDEEMFKQIRNQMVEFYSSSDRQIQCLYFMIYLLDYNSVVKMGNNQILDMDDFIHFLIVLARYPRVFEKDSIFKNKLKDTAISYAKQLINQKNPAYPYYLLQVPFEYFMEEVSFIASTTHLFETFSWKIFAKFLFKEDFNQFVNLTTDKFVNSTDNYLIGAKILMQYTEAREKCMDLLMIMLIKHITQRKIFQREEITEALELFKYWLSSYDHNDRSFHKIYEMMASERELTRLLIDPDYERIQYFFLKCNFAFMYHIDFYCAQMFQKLIRLNGIEVYYVYVKALLKAADFTLSRLGKFEQLKIYRYEMLKTCKTLFEHPNFEELIKLPSSIKLLEYINQLIFSSDQSYFRDF